LNHFLEKPDLLTEGRPRKGGRDRGVVSPSERRRGGGKEKYPFIGIGKRDCSPAGKERKKVGTSRGRGEGFYSFFQNEGGEVVFASIGKTGKTDRGGGAEK